MLQQIADILAADGYAPFLPNQGGVFAKVTNQEVYLVMFGMYEKEVKSESYIKVNQNAMIKAASIYRKPIRVLNVIVNQNGMFPKELMQIVSDISNTWLIAMDTGKIYIFENQTNTFDGLYQVFEQGLCEYTEENNTHKKTKIGKVNAAIVLLNIIAFVITLWLAPHFMDIYNAEYMLKMGAMEYEHVLSGEYYRLITAMFLHFGIGHLLNNMILLAYLGNQLEKAIGSMKYFLIYMLSGIIASFSSFLFHYFSQDYAVCAGASGAIFGVVGAMLLVVLQDRKQAREISPRSLILMTTFTIYFGFTTTGIDNMAHIGGFVSGFILSKIFQYVKLK